MERTANISGLEINEVCLACYPPNRRLLCGEEGGTVSITQAQQQHAVDLVCQHKCFELIMLLLAGDTQCTASGSLEG